MRIINVNGAIALFFANFIGKIFGAIYRIPLSNLLGTEGIGLYQMAFPIYSFLLTMITGGISVTLSRKIARARGMGNSLQIQKEYKIGKNISFFLGAILFVFLIVFAYPISFLQGNENAFYGYIAISIGFIFACMLGAYRGYYQGFGNMVPTAVSQILEQIIKLIVGLVFAWLFMKNGMVAGVFGALLGISVSEIVCYIYFKFLNRKQPKQKIKVSVGEYKNFFKEILPVGATYGMLPLSSLIDSFLVVNLLSFSGYLTNYATSLYGIETGMILPLINMPNVLISALAISAVPEISYKLAKGENVSQGVSKIFKLCLIFILPCCVGLFVLANPILSLIYPGLDISMLNIATILLKFSVFEMFFLCFVTISNSLLQAISKAKTSLLSLVVGILTKIVLTIILVLNSTINIYGLVIASTIGYFISASINVLRLKKECGFSLKMKEIFAPIFSGVAMLVLLLFLLAISRNNSIGTLILIIGVCAFTYFTMLILLRQFSFKEIKNMLQKRAD